MADLKRGETRTIAAAGCALLYCVAVFAAGGAKSPLSDGSSALTLCRYNKNGT